MRAFAVLAVCLLQARAQLWVVEKTGQLGCDQHCQVVPADVRATPECEAWLGWPGGNDELQRLALNTTNPWTDRKSCDVFIPSAKPFAPYAALIGGKTFCYGPTERESLLPNVNGTLVNTPNGTYTESVCAAPTYQPNDWRWCPCLCPNNTVSNEMNGTCDHCCRNATANAPNVSAVGTIEASSNGTGAVEWSDCGMVSAQGWYSCCPKGEYSLDRGLTCVQCPKGQYQTVGALSCLDCPVGNYSDELGSTACHECPANSYGPTEGRDSCIRCREGALSPPFSTDICQCVSCPEGTRRDEATQACVGCGEGTYAPYSVDTCYPCPPGSMSGANATACQQCAPGEVARGYPNVTGSRCDSCPEKGILCSSGVLHVKDAWWTSTPSSRIGPATPMTQCAVPWRCISTAGLASNATGGAAKARSNLSADSRLDTSVNGSNNFSSGLVEDNSFSCLHGYGGLLCSACDTSSPDEGGGGGFGFYRQGGVCHPCGSANGPVLAASWPPAYILWYSIAFPCLLTIVWLVFCMPVYVLGCRCGRDGGYDAQCCLACTGGGFPSIEEADLAQELHWRVRRQDKMKGLDRIRVEEERKYGAPRTKVPKALAIDLGSPGSSRGGASSPGLDDSPGDGSNRSGGGGSGGSGGRNHQTGGTTFIRGRGKGRKSKKVRVVESGSDDDAIDGDRIGNASRDSPGRDSQSTIQRRGDPPPRLAINVNGGSSNKNRVSPALDVEDQSSRHHTAAAPDDSELETDSLSPGFFSSSSKADSNNNSFGAGAGAGAGGNHDGDADGNNERGVEMASPSEGGGRQQKEGVQVGQRGKRLLPLFLPSLAKQASRFNTERRKLVIGFLQVFALVATNVAVPWPPLLLSALSLGGSAVNINLPEAVALDCSLVNNPRWHWAVGNASGATAADREHTEAAAGGGSAGGGWDVEEVLRGAGLEWIGPTSLVRGISMSESPTAKTGRRSWTYGGRGETLTLAKFRVAMALPMLVVFVALMSYGCGRCVKRCCRRADRSHTLALRCALPAFVFLFILYPHTVRMIAAVTACVNIEGRFYLAYDHVTECDLRNTLFESPRSERPAGEENEGEQERTEQVGLSVWAYHGIIAAPFFFVLYALGIPYAMMSLLRRFRDERANTYLVVEAVPTYLVPSSAGASCGRLQKGSVVLSLDPSPTVLPESGKAWIRFLPRPSESSVFGGNGGGGAFDVKLRKDKSSRREARAAAAESKADDEEVLTTAAAGGGAGKGAGKGAAAAAAAAAGPKPDRTRPLWVLLRDRGGLPSPFLRSNHSLWFDALGGWMYKDYEQPVFWWELVEFGWKLATCCLLCFVLPGTTTQLVVALGMCVLKVLAIAVVQPFESIDTDMMSLYLHSVLAVTICFGIVLRSHEAREAAAAAAAAAGGVDVSGSIVSAFLMSLLVVPALVAVMAALWNATSESSCRCCPPCGSCASSYNCLWWCDPENPGFYYGDGDEGDVGTSDDEGDEEESDDDVDEWDNTFDL